MSQSHSSDEQRGSPVLKQYDYGPRKWPTVAFLLLALAGAALMTYFAVFLDGPIQIHGFRLNQLQGKIFFGVFAVLSTVGLCCLCTMVFAAFVHKRRVALTKTHLILPKPTRMGLSRNEIQIPFDAIAFMAVGKFIGRTQLLRLEYLDGTIHIPSNMLRNREEFDDLCQAVRQFSANAANGDLT